MARSLESIVLGGSQDESRKRPLSRAWLNALDIDADSRASTQGDRDETRRTGGADEHVAGVLQPRCPAPTPCHHSAHARGGDMEKHTRCNESICCCGHAVAGRPLALRRGKPTVFEHG